MQRISRIGLIIVVVLAISAGSFTMGVSQGKRKAIADHGGVDFGQLTEVYDLLSRKYDGDIDPTKLIEGAKAGMAASTGDPYTVYLNQEALKTLNDDLSGTLTGIGAEVGIRNQRLVIIAPIADAPAAKAGLRAKDEIIKIGEEDPSGLSLDEAVRKIRGPEGTQVKLTIVRGNGQPFEVTITRAVINVVSIKSEMKGDVGYIQLTRFGSDTINEMTQAAKDLKSRGAKKFILDLRNNPGGYLDGAVSVSSHWLTEGELVVEERSKTGSPKKHFAESGGQLKGVKTVVLINGGSASASEIVAGALQDHGLARLVGEKTFGKGSVQGIEKLSDKGGLKITIANWHTPKGRHISKEGIKPDVEVKRESADIEADRDPQLDSALELLR
jgi:carboxyl-terminal processing protease